MPSQGLLSHLYGLGSLSVIGEDWAQTREPELSLPGRIVAGRELQPGHKPCRYFELGVGKGILYSRFVESGWQCSGVEPGAWGRGLPDVYADFDSIPGSQVADVIVALDVLEHVADPIGTLRKLRAIAAPGARLYCATPNRQSLRAKLGRERWRMLRPLGHVNYWSKKSIVEAMSTTGFAVKELRASDLWEPRPIRSLRQAAAGAVERLGLGDQWIVMAEVT
jgi:SAM-dependent methyltransferase